MIDLDIARASHRIFVDKLELAVLEIITPLPDADQVRNDTLCKLGQWLYGDGAPLRETCGYSDLVATHQRFHTTAAEFIIAAKTETRDLDALKAKVHIDQASADVMSAIDRLEKALGGGNLTAALTPPVLTANSSPIPWDPSLELGIDAIDEHHRAIVKVFNKFIGLVAEPLSAVAVVDGISGLTMLLKTHFEVEEGVMRTLGMPAEKFDAHCKRHSAILEECADLKSQADTNSGMKVIDALERLRHATIDHIASEDQIIREYVA